MITSALRLPRLLVLLASAALFAVAARADVSETFTQTYPISADGTLSLSNVNGSVEIVAWDRPEISLEAVKRAPDQEHLDNLYLKIDATPTSLSIKTEYRKKLFRWFGSLRGEVRYQLRVPATLHLRKIDVVNADITVRGLTGSVDLDGVNGRIEATGLTGSGRFDTVNGSIAVTYAALPATGEIKLDTVNGSCRITLPKTASFELLADNVNGGIRCDVPLTLQNSSRHSLRGQAGTGGPRIVLDSVNGSLEVRAP